MLSKVLVYIIAVTFAVSPQNASAATSLKIISVKVSDQTVNVTSSAISGLKNAKYEFAYSTTQNGKVISKSIISSVPIATIKNLNWFYQYQIKVRLINGSTKYQYSKPYTFAIKGPAIQSLAFSQITHTQAKVTWAGNSIYDSYHIYIDKLKYSTKNTYYDLNNLTPGSNYKVAVVGVSGINQGVLQNAEILSTLQTGPEKITIVPSATSLAFTWTAVPGATGYKVYKDEIYIGSTTNLNYNLTGLNPYSIYFVEVSAMFGEKETNKTLEKVQTLSVKAAKPVISNINSTYATVSWTANPDAKSYLISLYDQTGLTPVSVGKSSGTYKVAQGLNSIVLQGLTPSQIYTVTLTYVYDKNESLPSDFAIFTATKPILGSITNLATTTTTSSISWSPADGAIQYEVFRDNLYLTVTEKSVTSYQYTGLVPGTTYKLGIKARYYDSNGVLQTSDQSSINITTSTDANEVPKISISPVITLTSGVSPVIGMTLSANTGTWSSTTPISSYQYQWQRGVDTSSFTNINGATSSSYAVSSNDLNLYLRVRITATNSNASANVFSSATNVVIATGNLLPPVITGKPVVGQVLDTSNGSWNANGVVTYTYQWLSNGSSISNATASKYTLTSSEAGTRISVTVTATTLNGSTAATSASTAIVYPTGNTVVPVISGNVRVGNVLSTTDGTWLNSPTLTYNWQRSSDGIAWVNTGGTSSTYTITNDDAGYYLRVQVIGTKTSGTTAAINAESDATALVPNLVIANTVRPVISGSWTAGQTLSTSTGSWTTNGTISYQWQYSSDNSTWSNISGATSSSYLLTSAEASSYMRVQVTNTSSTGSGIAYSNTTPKVGAPYNTALPTVSGTVQVGATQTVTNGTWSNTPTSYTYQWQSSSDGIAWSNISGATSSTYAPTFAIGNLQVRVSISAVNAVDTATVTTAIVSGFLPPAATAVPGVSGTVQVGQTLTSDGGTWPGTSNSYRVFTWQRSSDNGVTWSNISGATSSTYVLVVADTGYLIRSQVSLTTNAGTASAYSLPTTAVIP